MKNDLKVRCAIWFANLIRIFLLHLFVRIGKMLFGSVYIYTNEKDEVKSVIFKNEDVK